MNWRIRSPHGAARENRSPSAFANGDLSNAAAAVPATLSCPAVIAFAFPDPRSRSLHAASSTGAGDEVTRRGRSSRLVSTDSINRDPFLVRTRGQGSLCAHCAVSQSLFIVQSALLLSCFWQDDRTSFRNGHVKEGHSAVAAEYGCKTSPT